MSGEVADSSVVKPQTSSWKALRTIGAFVVAGLMTGCAGSIKNDLRHMPEWARYVDAAILVAAGSLFLLAGVGMIRHRRDLAAFYLSLPGSRLLIWYSAPERYYLVSSVLGGVVASLMGAVCLIAGFVVLAGSGSG